MSDRQNGDRPRQQAVLSIFKRGVECAKRLVEENDSLRGQIRVLEEQGGTGQVDGDRSELVKQVDGLEFERKKILERLNSVEEENQQFANRYVKIEEENNNLANLYVASHQLHSTLDPAEVLRVIIEIVINLIGAEVLCVYVVDEREGSLEPVGCEGAKLKAFPRARLGSGVLGKSVLTGEVSTLNSTSSTGDHPENDPPVVVIPLRVQDRPVGVIAIHSLFQQKDGFSPLDHELFTLLAAHAATALFAARLHAQSERKLNTIQGFIDLLTK
ncbi:MAG: GAF domain-containing protein [Myxococcota bacterium]